MEVNLLTIAATVVGGGLIVWLLKFLGKGSNQSPPIEGVKPGPVRVPEQAAHENAPSSEKGLKAMRERLKKVFGKSLILLLVLPMLAATEPNIGGTHAPECAANKLTQEQEDWVNKQMDAFEAYVRAVEKEQKALLFNERKDTQVETWVKDQGRVISVEVTVPVRYPIFQEDGNVTVMQGPPIRRAFDVIPTTASLIEPNGFRFFSGLLVGGHWNSLKGMQPMVGFEAVAWVASPVVIGLTPIVDPTAMGLGLTAGPSKKPNMRIYAGASREYRSDAWAFQIGIAALVGWDN